jgi:bifunctional enzyme CysN/CysC
MNNRETQNGLIWITGYSGSGKTTLGRKVDAELRSNGFRSIFLDGDDLRSIFGNVFGYSRQERIQLALIYLRLCSHLQGQGYIVILSAIALFDEAAEWAERNIPKFLQVFLDTPSDELLRRDSLTKKIYKNKINSAELYDEPWVHALKIDAHKLTEINQVAKYIINHFIDIQSISHDLGRTSHWAKFYQGSNVPTFPSPFARHIGNCINPGHLLEIGCGNGRDSAYFSSIGHYVTALDLSVIAIEKCEVDHRNFNIRFLSGDVSILSDEGDEFFDNIYTRFVLHAMPLQEEVVTIKAAHTYLKIGGQIHIECRSINDPMMRLGEVISPTERIFGHYRRFLIMEDLISRLNLAGFEIVSSIESSGLAVFRDEDPVVIRISARKVV